MQLPAQHLLLQLQCLRLRLLSISVFVKVIVALMKEKVALSRLVELSVEPQSVRAAGTPSTHLYSDALGSEYCACFLHLPVIKDMVRSVAFSHDGKQVASGSRSHRQDLGRE
jgi:hypothetical protein